MVIIGGVTMPMVMSEVKADGDVTGPYDQAAMVKEFCDMLKADGESWFSGFTFYQFRDRGRLGLEIQDKTHYAMPLRTMTYDALGYIKEYNDIKKHHKLNKDSFCSPEEFLSGINKSDRFHPIITIVLYYGESLWDGPTCLSDMMISMSNNIKEYFSDYKLNLVQILDSDKYTFYNEDVRDVFNIIRNIYNDDFDSIYREYESRNVDIDVMELICNITSVPKLMDLCTDTEQGGTVNMCEAMKRFQAECESKGMKEGIDSEKVNSIISMLEFGITREQILTRYTKEDLERAEAAIANEN